MISSNRVVVTGMGVVSPCGIGLDSFWDSLIHCKSGIGPITLFDTTDYPLKVAGEVKNFDLRDYFGRDCKPKRLGRQTQLGLAACKMAIEHAGLKQEDLGKGGGLQLVTGICSSAADVIEAAKEIIMTKGANRVRPYMVGASQPHAISAAMAYFLGVPASVTTLSSACPAGLDAVAYAAKIIREGKKDLVIAGAMDSPINNTGVAGFATAGSPPITDEVPPDKQARPFDVDSIGGPMSEGAGFLVLERLDCVLARGGTPYLEILGGCSVMDALGSFPLEGLGRSMSGALQESGIRPDEVGYISANAIGSLLSDRTEISLIKKVFGDVAYRIPISSIKGATGNPLAAAGIFQVISCALAMQHGVIPPVTNLENLDPECDLDIVCHTSRKVGARYCIANMHGMAGENSTLVMKRVS